MIDVKEISKKIAKNNNLSDSERVLAIKLYRIMSTKGEYDLNSLKKKLKTLYTFDELTASLAWLYFHDYIIIKKIVMNNENQITTMKYQVRPNKTLRNTKYSLQLAS